MAKLPKGKQIILPQKVRTEEWTTVGGEPTAEIRSYSSGYTEVKISLTFNSLEEAQNFLRGGSMSIDNKPLGFTYVTGRNG